MKRIFIPTKGPADWQALLAKPKLHWKPGASAMSLAASWEAAQPGFPVEILSALNSGLGRVELLSAVPEWEVALPGGITTSHTDLMVWVNCSAGLSVVAVEGKVDEPFGELLAEKRAAASPGQTQRLAYLHERLRLSERAPDSLRYQLFHRCVSALDTAVSFSASAAVMLVHSFSKYATGFGDFEAFATHLGCAVGKGRIAMVPGFEMPRLYIGWVQGDLQFASQDLRVSIGTEGSHDDER